MKVRFQEIADYIVHQERQRSVANNYVQQERQANARATQDTLGSIARQLEQLHTGHAELAGKVSALDLRYPDPNE